MTPENISDRESKFALKLVDSNAKQFTAGDAIDIGGGFSITPLTTNISSYYYKTPTTKTQICLHFTVGMIQSDIATLTKANNHMSVQYVVDRLGHIYRLFPDEFWSYHLGASAVGGNAAMSKQSIGIEISNYGPLKLNGAKYEDVYGSTYTMDDSLVDKVSFRGYDYYAKMSERQKEAVACLAVYLSKKHGIPLDFKEFLSEPFKSKEDALAFRGIFCHCHVRSDKYDLPPEQAMQIKDAIAAVTSPVAEPAQEPVQEPEKGPDKEPEKEPEKETEKEPEPQQAPAVESRPEPVRQVEPPARLPWWQRLLEILRDAFR